jgi:pyruvyl transferase EpsO
MNEQILEQLKQKLLVIPQHFDRNARCIYVDYPVHANIGDLLINLGSERFFTDQQIQIWRRYNIFDFPETIDGIDKNIVFLLHGGGNLGDIWPSHQLLRERILRQYPKNRIIFLPQTAFYGSAESERKGVQTMAQHGNLHVFVRDTQSLERLNRGGLYDVSVMPDMAHSLVGNLKSPREAELRSLMLFRTDQEVGGLPAFLGHSDRRSFDWNEMISDPHKVISGGTLALIRGVGRFGGPLNLVNLWYWNRDVVLKDAIGFFSRFETVVTNRLHAIILGLLLGRRVVWFDNSYGKLSSYVRCWLSESPNLELATEATTIK